MTKLKANLNRQAQEILKMAANSGVQSNFLFSTTFKRYQVQLDVLDELEKLLYSESMLVEKQYGNHTNVYTNPAIMEYVRVSDSANKTVSSIIKIIKDFGVKEKHRESDPLLQLLSGGAKVG